MGTVCVSLSLDSVKCGQWFFYNVGWKMWGAVEFLKNQRMYRYCETSFLCNSPGRWSGTAGVWAPWGGARSVGSRSMHTIIRLLTPCARAKVRCWRTQSLPQRGLSKGGEPEWALTTVPIINAKGKVIRVSRTCHQLGCCLGKAAWKSLAFGNLCNHERK